MTDMFPNYNGRSEEQNANEKKIYTSNYIPPI